MVSTKVPTAPLKAYDEIHVVAGQCARTDDVPWWACFGYAASVNGTTDAYAIVVTAQTWLRGYLTDEEQESPKGDTEKLIVKLINNPL